SFTQAHLLPSLPTAANSPQHLVMNDSTTKTISNDSDSSSQNSPSNPLRISAIGELIETERCYDNNLLNHDIMLELKKLDLCLIVDERKTFVDSNDLKINIINHVPKLYKFTFNIRSSSRFYNENGVTNNFPGGIFQCVRKVSLFDERHFEHEFFLQIQKSIPLMQQFIVVNQQRQTNKKFGKANNENGDLATIHYPDLEHLDHLDTCIHYHRQFLLDAKMCLTYHVRVYMNYEIVDIKVTRNFRRNSTRSNCAKMNHVYLFRKLEYHGPFYEFFRPKIQFPEDIKDYFPYAEIK
ncbi:unnamed protein product, partial [Rotaria socialis]